MKKILLCLSLLTIISGCKKEEKKTNTQIVENYKINNDTKEFLKKIVAKNVENVRTIYTPLIKDNKKQIEMFISPTENGKNYDTIKNISIGKLSNTEDSLTPVFYNIVFNNKLLNSELNKITVEGKNNVVKFGNTYTSINKDGYILGDIFDNSTKNRVNVYGNLKKYYKNNWSEQHKGNGYINGAGEYIEHLDNIKISFIASTGDFDNMKKIGEVFIPAKTTDIKVIPMENGIDKIIWDFTASDGKKYTEVFLGRVNYTSITKDLSKNGIFTLGNQILILDGEFGGDFLNCKRGIFAVKSDLTEINCLSGTLELISANTQNATRKNLSSWCFINSKIENDDEKITIENDIPIYHNIYGVSTLGTLLRQIGFETSKGKKNEGNIEALE